MFNITAKPSLTFNQKLLSELQPQAIWSLFAQLSDIPRPSNHEEKVRDWIIKLAQENNLIYRVDKIGNIAIYKNAQNSDSLTKILLQAHMDMVTEKDPEQDHNFFTNSLKLQIKDTKIYATNTTLGADNGIGLCAALAVLLDTTISHPPIEVLITMNEEAGMIGIANLDPELISSDMIINLDCEEEGNVYVSSAGGRDIHIDMSANRFRPTKTVSESFIRIQDSFFYDHTLEDWQTATISLRGMQGGHSGVDIHLERINPIQELSNILLRVPNTNYSLISIDGGNKLNAIPRECTVKIAYQVNQPYNMTNETTFSPKREGFMERLQSEFSEYLETELARLSLTEPGAKLSIAWNGSSESDTQLWSNSYSAKFLNLINSLPNGIISMSRLIPDLVQTSSNIGRVSTDTDNGIITVGVMLRSSDDQELYRLGSQIESIVNLSSMMYPSLSNFSSYSDYKVRRTFFDDFNRQGGFVSAICFEDVKSGWKAKKDNQLLEVFQSAHKHLYDKPAKIMAIHAGLECGQLTKYLPKADVISFGPDIRDAHTPRENVSIKSVEEFYRLLIELLARLN